MITDILDKGTSAFKWIDLSNPSKEELEVVAEKYHLHPNLVYDSLQPDHLPKYEKIGDIQFIILRVFDLKATSDAETIQGMTRKLALFVGQDFLISIHRVDLPFIDQIKHSILVHKEYKTQYDIIADFFNSTIISYQPPSNNIIHDIDFYESKIFLKEKMPSILKSLYFIKRKAQVIHRVLHLLNPVIDSLRTNYPPPIVADLRDSLTARIIGAEQSIEQINNLLNVYISLSSQRTNEVVRILTIFSVFFMPLTFLAGVYGMNFNFMPELYLQWAYPALLIAMAGVSLSIYFWFRKKGWL